MTDLTWLAPGKQTFVDNQGRPLVGGLVYHYEPGTDTLKDTWQDPEAGALNTNPVVLDGRGQAPIWGNGIYRQRLTDADGNAIWDREAGIQPLPRPATLVASVAVAKVSNFDPSVQFLQVEGFAVSGDGGAALYVRVNVIIAPGGTFQSADGAYWQIAEPILKLPMFGTGLVAWQNAANVLNAGLSFDLVVPAGVWSINRAGLADPLHQGLITFTNSAGIRFEPGAEVQFDYITLPLFCFAGCSRGGIMGSPRFRFTGASPATAPFTRAAYSAVSGFTFSSWIGGGDYELASMILTNCSGLIFENFDLESTTPGSEGHAVPIAFNIKAPGAGTYAKDNAIRNAHLRDLQFGVLYVQQDGLQVTNLDVDRRIGTNADGRGPGHALYASGLGTGTPNINCVVDGLRDGSNPVNWPASAALNLGTTAIKDSQSCEFLNVRSYHPAGLVHTFQQTFDCTLKGWSWRTTDATAGGVATINAVQDNKRNRISGFDIYCPNKVFSLGQNGSGVWSDNVIEDFYIASHMDLGVGAPTTGIFDFFGANNVFSNIRVNPRGGFVGTPQAAAVTRGGAGISTNNSIDMRFVGSATPAQRRFGEGGGNSWARMALDIRASDQNYLNNDELAYAVSVGTIIETGVQATRGWTVDTGIAGIETVTFQAPGRGMFIVTVDVEDNGRTSRMGGSYLVSFANQASLLHDAQVIGAPYTVGAAITLLGVTCNENGAIFVTYTKGSAFFATVSLSWLRIGAIAD